MGRARAGYAPYDLATDPGELQLTRSEAANQYGSTVAWSRRTDPSPRATIFLHGAAGSWTTWTPLFAAASAAGTRIQNPVLFDLPGWGSGSLTPRGEADVIAAVCTLVRECAEQLGFTEWDLVGHSMGGFLALELAAAAPQSTLSVATISATGRSVLDATRHPLSHFWRLPTFIMLWRVMQVLGRFRDGAAPVRLLRALHLLRGSVSPLFRHVSRVPATVIAAFSAEIRPVSFSAAVRQLRNYDVTASWSRVTCPVRACQGDRDAFARREDLDALARILPSTTCTVIDDCGHFPLIERPAEVLEALGFG
ncbi:MAG TPA: alpha/beta hydrolase [Galbitalea sp.]|jgi:pimeloyl-ACP methyl ester carboxylesterase